jgi:hypothetical protein
MKKKLKFFSTDKKKDRLKNQEKRKEKKKAIFSLELSIKN